jgi:RNA polymerase sigma factor (sigma-70 family)
VSLERQFLDHLAVIDQVVQFIGHRHRLPADAIEELQSAIHLKIIDNDYEVLRKFEGRSSIRTYLTAVVQRHFLDGRTAVWGRWRPCACARRVGPAGILLDQLLTRDAVSLDEALARVRERYDVSELALRSLAVQIPVRTPRRFVGEESLDEVAADAGVPTPETTLGRDEGERAESALHAALDALGYEDQVILKYRFVYGLQVSQIARLTGLEQKPLYRRLEGILKVMRREMEALGLTREEVLAVVGSPELDMGKTINWPDLEKRPEVRPCDE